MSIDIFDMRPDVKVAWKTDDDASWHCYKLLAIESGVVWLRGRADDAGAQFEGGDILVPLASIDVMEVV